MALYNTLFLQANMLMAEHNTQNTTFPRCIILPHVMVFFCVDNNDEICYCFPVALTVSAYSSHTASLSSVTCCDE